MRGLAPSFERHRRVVVDRPPSALGVELNLDPAGLRQERDLVRRGVARIVDAERHSAVQQPGEPFSGEAWASAWTRGILRVPHPLGSFTRCPSGLTSKTVGKARIPKFLIVSRVVSSRIGNGSGRPAQVLAMIGLSFCVELDEVRGLGIVEGQISNLSRSAAWSFVEIDPLRQTAADARPTPEAPEVDDHPLALEVGDLDVFFQAAGARDMPGGRLLAVMLRDRRELQVDGAHVEVFARLERDLLPHALVVGKRPIARELVAARRQLQAKTSTRSRSWKRTRSFPGMRFM